MIASILGELANTVRFNRAMKYNSIQGQAQQWAKAGFSPNMVTEHGGHGAPGIPSPALGTTTITGMMSDLAGARGEAAGAALDELEFQNLTQNNAELFSKPNDERTAAEARLVNEIRGQETGIGLQEAQTDKVGAEEEYIEGVQTDLGEKTIEEKDSNIKVNTLKVQEMKEGIKEIQQRVRQSEQEVEKIKAEMSKMGYEESMIEAQIQRLNTMNNNDIARLALDAKRLDEEILNWSKQRNLTDTQIEDIRSQNPEGKALLKQMEADGKISSGERATLFFINLFKGLGSGLLIPVK